MGVAATRHFEETNNLIKRLTSEAIAHQEKSEIHAIHQVNSFIRCLDYIRNRFEYIVMYSSVLDETSLELFISFAKKYLNEIESIFTINASNTKSLLEGALEQYRQDSRENWRKIKDDIDFIRSQKIRDNLEVTEKRIISQIENFETRFKTKARKAELEVQKEQFTIAAEISRINAQYWLKGLVGTALFFALLIVILFCNSLISTSVFKNIELMEKAIPESSLLGLKFYLFKHIAIRIVIISSCLYMLTFCIKNYNANRHNYTINLQRANSINGAMWLIGSVMEPTGDQILIQATNAIFTHQPTGYSSKEPENTNSVSEKIMEKIIEKI